MLPGIGVFGTGTIVRCLVPILKSCGFKVEAIWGRTKDLAADTARDLDIPFFTNKVDDVLLIKEVDVVLIVCPPHLQSPIAVKALGIGKHVMCGPPGGPGTLDVFKMVSAAQYYPSLLSVMCHGLRFLPAFVKMKSLIDDGYIGDVCVSEVRVHCGSLLKEKYDWTCDEMMGGGVLNTFGSVIIDIISFLTGQKAVYVNGMLKTFVKQTEKIKGIRQITSDDFCTFQLEFENETCATVTLNNHLPGQFVHEVLVCGTKGHLLVKGADLYGHKTDAPKEELIHKEASNILDEQKTGVCESIRQDIPITYLKGLIRLMDAVKEAFRSEQDRQAFSTEPLKPAATFEDALYVQSVVDGVRRSSKEKTWVKVNVMSQLPEPNPHLSGASVRRSTFT